MVSALDSRASGLCLSPGREHCVVLLGKTLYSHSAKKILPLGGMLVHRSSLPHNLLGFPNNLPVPIYTPGWRGNRDKQLQL